MKMFKKLMAVALAGVMALAVLTGCGTSVNEKEIIKIFNDTLKTTAAEQAMTEKDVKINSVKADSGMKEKAQSVAKIMATDVKEDSTWKTQLDAKIDALSIIKNSKIINVNVDYEAVDGAVSLIGFADVTINGATYTVAVIKVPTQKKA